MSAPHKPRTTLRFVDQYCALYQDLFADVRSFDHFKWLHVGLISEIPRKSLPAIAKAVGLSNGQGLHHFVADSPWNIDAFRHRRWAILHQALQGRSFTLCMDETGDKKKGHTTDYVARQYIGKLGKIDQGLVSVNAYGVLEGITFPLLFNVFKPRPRLKPTDQYATKPPLAIHMIQTLTQLGFPFRLVVADSLYGESTEFLEALLELDLDFVVAMRANHGVLLGPGPYVRYTAWKPFDRGFADGTCERRYLCEIIFGHRRDIRYYQLTTDPQALPEESTWFVMTNLSQAPLQDIGNGYGMRMWIEYGFKQSKQELGWTDFRVTSYPDIERWWELVYSAYLMVSLQAEVFARQQPGLSPADPAPEERTTGGREEPDGAVPTIPEAPKLTLRQHKWWNAGKGWKHVLNNLRLLTQPFISYCLLSPWLEILDIPSLREGWGQLLTRLHECHAYCPI
jgi:SRSO17 transposase